ncbi:zinc finger MYM-type protein 1-like protein [Tanacetum coccineum]
MHCFAHQLQLALVAASKDGFEVHTFFKHINFIVNVIGSSTKRNDQLQDAQLAEISHLVEIGELESGRGANQMQNLQRPGDTKWSSHFKSICSFLKLFGPTRVVLNGICLGQCTGSQKGDAKYALTQFLQELNNRFSESVSELLRLSVTLDPKKSFNADDISKLVTKYYPLDFTEQERIEFKLELQHFELDSDPELKNVSSLSALCKGLRKTKLRSTMSDDFLKSNMILSIEREIVGTLCNDKIIDDFYSKSQRRVQMMKKRKVTND